MPEGPASCGAGLARRAVVMVVGGAIGKRLDELRRRWDPVMAARIPLHLTLVHRVVDHDAAARRVDTLAGAAAPIHITLTAAAMWAETPAYGVYLGVDDPSGTVAALHQQLVDLEAPEWARVPYRPHVTLVHGRTVAPERAEPAWQALRDERFDLPVELDAIDVLELIEPDGWTTVRSVRLGALRLRPAAPGNDADGDVGTGGIMPP